jgi:uncharacterized protein
MMIDGHCHMVGEGWHDMSFFIGMARVATAPMGKLTGEYPDPAELINNLMPVLSDTTGEKLVANMDTAGIDKTCVFAHDTGMQAGEPEVTMEEQNRLVAEAAARFPDRLLAFFSIDPRRDGALDLFKKGVEDWGMKGLKLHPTAGFYPYDPACYPFYERCLEYGVPVLFHTGNQPLPMKARFTQPINVDDVAADFPDLSIIMAHVGHLLWHEALFVAARKPNIYFDFSDWQMTFLEYPQEFYRMLRRIIDDLGPWRVFFGTDGPYLNVLCPLEKWVGAIKEPDLSSCPEVSFTDEEKRIIMGDAFARLMGI